MTERKQPQDWREVSGKKEQIIRSLQKSGIPLETRALQAVHAFCKSHATDPLRAHSLGPLLWREDDEHAFREVDAGALLREEMSFQHIQIAIEAYYFIEAKYREGVEWFAFDSPHSARIPVASNVAFSRVVDETYNKASENIPVRRLAALRTDGEIERNNQKSTPERETLTQNASAALADLVLHSVKNTLLKPLPYPPKVVPHQTKLLADFTNSLTDEVDWRERLADYLLEIPVTAHQELLAEAPGPYYIDLRFFIPILVVNGRLNHVGTQDGIIADMTPMSYAVTGERLPGWPGKDVFLNPSAQFPLFVTDVDGIPAAMQSAYDQVQKIRNAFVTAAVSGRLNGTALDSVVTAAVLKSYTRETPRLRDLEAED